MLLPAIDADPPSKEAVAPYSREIELGATASLLGFFITLYYSSTYHYLSIAYGILHKVLHLMRL
jgi:hypothetical protein